MSGRPALAGGGARARATLAAIFAGLCVIGAAWTPGRATADTHEGCDWVASPAERRLLPAEMEKPSLPARRIPEAQVPKAMAVLERVTHFEVLPSELTRYGVRPQPGKRVFVVRAAAVDAAAGSFEVARDGPRLWVRHAGRPTRERETRCLPLLVFLDDAPQKIVVTVATGA